MMSSSLPQSGQIKQMEEVKISKKSKVGILPFVTGFEEFAELAETIFRNAERRGDLDKAYVKLIRAVFMNGETRPHRSPWRQSTQETVSVCFLTGLCLQWRRWPTRARRPPGTW